MVLHDFLSTPKEVCLLFRIISFYFCFCFGVYVCVAVCMFPYKVNIIIFNLYEELFCNFDDDDTQPMGLLW